MFTFIFIHHTSRLSVITFTLLLGRSVTPGLDIAVKENLAGEEHSICAIIDSQRIPALLNYVRPRGWVIISPLWWVREMIDPDGSRA